MGYREDYSEARKRIRNGEPVWVPSTKVVFMPPNFLVWLGADDPMLCVMESYSTHDLARYVVSQKVRNDVTVRLATPDEINTHRDDLVIAAGKITKKLQEPFLTRFVAVMIGIS